MTVPPRKPGTNPAPGSLPLTSALTGSAPLANLLKRLDESRLRFETVAAALPALLLPSVRPGPLDADGWMLLADNSASAAKLRQMLPAVQAQLLAAGWPQLEVKVKVQPRA
jgi:hypothetical protein